MKSLGAILLLFFLTNANANINDELDAIAKNAVRFPLPNIRNVLFDLLKKSCMTEDDFKGKVSAFIGCVGGDLDVAYNETFHQNMCQKKSVVKECQKNVLDKIEPCLLDTNRDLINETITGFDEYYDYFCSKPYDQVKMFYNSVFNLCAQVLNLNIYSCTFETPRSSKEVESQCKCKKIETYSQCFKQKVTDANIIQANGRFVKILQRVCSLAPRMSILSAMTVLLMAVGIYYINNSKY